MTYPLFDLGLNHPTLAQAATPASSPSVNAVGVPGDAAAPGTPAQGSSTTGASGSTTGTGATPPPGGGMAMFLPLILVMVFIMAFSMLQSKKERKRRETLLNSINKLDKVMVAGGIIGKVVELTDHEVVIQLEDGRMRVVRSAIQSVMSSNAKPATIAETKPDGVTAGV